jgi:hypothetical protein
MGWRTATQTTMMVTDAKIPAMTTQMILTVSKAAEEDRAPSSR